MSKIERFIEIFQMPPVMIPHIDFVVNEQEMDLVVGLGDDDKTVEEIAEMIGVPIEEAEQFVRKAYERSVIKKGAGRGPYARGPVNHDGPMTYSAAVFYRRLDPISMYEENWGDVPKEAREKVIDWGLQVFTDHHKPMFDVLRDDPAARPAGLGIPDFLLLEEALEIVDAAEDFVVVLCDCRSIVQACDRPVEVCVRLDLGAKMTLESGHGRRVSKDEMKQIVVDADRAGLMHAADRMWKEGDGVFGFCNCCACDCYAIRAAMQYGLDREYPRAHYVARRDMERCQQCAICIQRCHFGAFYLSDEKVEIDGRMRKEVLFDPEKCWGCGLCSTACPEAAITMEPLAHTVA